MLEFHCTIHGTPVDSDDRLEVINPATAAPLGACPRITHEQATAAVQAAHKAFDGWKKDEVCRRSVLEACGQTIREHIRELATIVTHEMGTPLAESVREVSTTAFWFSNFARLELMADVLEDNDGKRVEVRREPLGVVAAITPWNYPVMLAASKIVPALLAGNTVVLKPSPFAPLAVLRLGEILQEHFPPGVLNVISGGDELGQWLIAHPLVRKVAFTGSIETGKKIAAATAADLKRMTLELGGNDAAIVLADVDVDQVAEKLFWGAFTNAGQFCVGIKRLYIEETLFEPLVDRLVAVARATKIGDGLERTTKMGPVANKHQFSRIMKLGEDIRVAGATVRFGGQPFDGPGYFYPPTIVTGISDGSPLVDEEQFGPILPVMSFRDIDDAIERANATKFGLGGSIWTGDSVRGLELAARLDVGTAWVNQHAVFHPDAPFGGWKWSGIGYENGRWGLAEFTQFKVINTTSL